ncbi:MAG: hypothetical protein AVDCRST_MAG79-1904, partial [uncultured Thermoleophilia bacterium]
ERLGGGHADRGRALRRLRREHRLDTRPDLAADDGARVRRRLRRDAPSHGQDPTRPAGRGGRRGRRGGDRRGRIRGDPRRHRSDRLRPRPGRLGHGAGPAPAADHRHAGRAVGGHPRDARALVPRQPRPLRPRRRGVRRDGRRGNRL